MSSKRKQIEVETDDDEVESAEEEEAVDPVCNGLPMSIKQMQEYLIESHGVPLVLRKDGETAVICPYSNEVVEVPLDVSYFKPEWRESNLPGIVIGDRVFSPSYGFRVATYREDKKKNVNTLI